MITPGTPRRHLQDRVAGTVACTPGAPMLEVSDLVKRYGGVLALDGCSLQVPAGHLVGLLGPNGAGKTTVMRTLFGLVLPDAGTVRWRGRPVDARLAAVRVHAGGTGPLPSHAGGGADRLLRPAQRAEHP